MRKALIIGGGIGGLTLAVALRRKGVEAHVYEAAPELKPVGKGIWVPTNAMQVLDRLGLATPVLSAGCPLERILVRTAAGVSLLDVDVRAFAAKYGHLTVSVHRAELVRVLADALPPGALHLGARLVAFSEDDGGVTARFEDGRTATGDVLIGADGLRSAVRERLFPGVGLRYSGQTCYRGVAAFALPAGLERTCWEVWGGESRIGFSAIGPAQVYWFAPLRAPADSPLLPLEALAARYTAFPPPIPDILRHTPPDDILRTDLHDIPPLPKWWQGRVALLGDAAHAMTPNLGQGGAQAVEDAFVLAERLAEGGSPERAFEAYQRLRKPKADWVARTAWRLGQVAHLRSPLLRWARDLAMRLTPGWVNDAQIHRLLRLEY